MNNLKKYLIAFARLSRIKVILKDYFWSLTLLSIVAAGTDISILNLILAVFVCFFTHAYAFMVNDCEDADDDAMHEEKAQRNPVSSGFISRSEGIMMLQLIAFPTLILALLNNSITGLIITALALLAGHFYSWKKIRLKNMPFIDIVSHAFALSMFEVIYFLALPGSNITLGSIFILYGLGIFSAGGALYNQLRDYEVDQKSGLNNTTNILGKKKARIFAIFLYTFGIILVAIGAISRLFNIQIN